MDYDFIKFGAKVRYTWREYDYYSATAKGYGPIPYETKEKIVKICGAMRDKETKRFESTKRLNSYWCCASDYEILVKDENGNKFFADIESLDKYAEISDLNEEQLQQLRKEISCGSIYTSDYANSFGVDENILFGICEDYWNYLCEEYGDENAEEHDTPEEFAYFVA